MSVIVGTSESQHAEGIPNMKDNPFLSQFQAENEREQALEAQCQQSAENDGHQQAALDAACQHAQGFVIPILELLRDANPLYRGLQATPIAEAGSSSHVQRETADWGLLEVRKESYTENIHYRTSQKVRVEVGVKMLLDEQILLSGFACSAGNRQVTCEPNREALIAALQELHTPSARKRAAAQWDAVIYHALFGLAKHIQENDQGWGPLHLAGDYNASHWHCQWGNGKYVPKSFGDTLIHRFSRPVWPLEDARVDVQTYPQDSTCVGDWILKLIVESNDEFGGSESEREVVAAVRVRLDEQGHPAWFECAKGGFEKASPPQILRVPLQAQALEQALLRMAPPAPPTAQPKPDKKKFFGLF